MLRCILQRMPSVVIAQSGERPNVLFDTGREPSDTTTLPSMIDKYPVGGPETWVPREPSVVARPEGSSDTTDTFRGVPSSIRRLALGIGAVGLGVVMAGCQQYGNAPPAQASSSSHSSTKQPALPRHELLVCESFGSGVARSFDCPAITATNGADLTNPFAVDNVSLSTNGRLLKHMQIVNGSGVPVDSGGRKGLVTPAELGHQGCFIQAWVDVQVKRRAIASVTLRPFTITCSW